VSGADKKREQPAKRRFGLTDHRELGLNEPTGVGLGVTQSPAAQRSNARGNVRRPLSVACGCSSRAVAFRLSRCAGVTGWRSERVATIADYAGAQEAGARFSGRMRTAPRRGVRAPGSPVTTARRFV